MLRNRLRDADFDTERHATVGRELIRELNPTGTTFFKSRDVAERTAYSTSQVAECLDAVATELGLDLQEWGAQKQATTWQIHVDGQHASEDTVEAGGEA